MSRAVEVAESPSRRFRALDAARGDRSLVLALLVTLLLWNIPGGSYLLYPFKVLATWFHEMSHGIAMLVTGAGLEKLVVYRDTSGLAVPERGVAKGAQAFISSAGYMGTALLGAVLLVLGRTPRRARWVLGVIGGIMALSALLWVANGFGIAALVSFGVLLCLMGGFAGERLCGFLVNLIAAQMCINAVLDIRVLFAANMYVNGQPHQRSDAHVVSNLLGGPPWMWAAVWMMWSFGLFYVALRHVRFRKSDAILPSPAV